MTAAIEIPDGLTPEADALVRLFFTGEFPDSLLLADDDELRRTWDRDRDELMQLWRHPGCRPHAWWKYDAPRLPVGTFEGWYYDGQIPEPRRLLSGSGRPVHEVYAHSPLGAHFGIYDWLVDSEKSPPPIFESQHCYLKRHGLLFPRERRGPERNPAPRIVYLREDFEV